jgi:Flp pilus assembly protein TadG
MLRLANRKGIFVVLFGLVFMVLMGAAAMAIDMSRIWTMRNELQTAADAGAIAGAIQLNPPHNKNHATDTATVFAQLNKALYDNIQVEVAQTGQWDDDARVFTANANPPNAVYIEVSHGTNKLIMGALGIAAPKVRARATAWANAPVNNSSCIRPWSIPYVILMSKINTALGLPNTQENLTRDFTDEDRETLNAMSDSARTFKLKMGSGNGNQTTVDDPPPGSEQPGNYQAVKLPRKYSADGTPNPDGIAPQSGANEYERNISGETCWTLGVGDILEVQTGNMVGKTLSGIERQGNEQHYVCYTLDSDGTCRNQNGTTGVDIKAAFHLCYSGCNGAAEVEVQMLGSFTLTRVQPVGGGAPDPENPAASITGIFKPITAAGPIGPGPTTLKRIILVR